MKWNATIFNIRLDDVAASVGKRLCDTDILSLNAISFVITP